MSDPHRWKCDCEFLNPDWTADKIEAVRASDYDRDLADMTRQRDEARTLLAELHALVVGECPALLSDDSGGEPLLDIAIRTALPAKEPSSEPLSGRVEVKT